MKKLGSTQGFLSVRVNRFSEERMKLCPIEPISTTVTLYSGSPAIKLTSSGQPNTNWPSIKKTRPSSRPGLASSPSLKE